MAPPVAAPSIADAWSLDLDDLSTDEAPTERQNPTPICSTRLLDAALADSCLAFALRGLASLISLPFARSSPRPARLVHQEGKPS
jgi:hypothetical protein